MSVVIIYNGYKIIRKSLAGIMDEADMDLLKDIVVLLNNNRKENWIDLHNLRVIKFGPYCTSVPSYRALVYECSPGS